MGKRFGSTIRIIVALFLSVFMTNFAPVMVAYADPGQNQGEEKKDKKDTPPAGNNGTVKIDGDDIDTHANDNDPHVGCSFKVEWFGYDSGSQTSKVTFEAQQPTDANQLVSPTGTQTVAFTGNGPGDTLDHTENYTLAFAGAPQQNQGYHVKLTVDTTGPKGNDSKFKVFWVEGCEAPKKPVTPLAPSFDDQCGKRSDAYTINTTEGVIYKVDNQVVTGINPGVGTVTISAEAEAGYVLTGYTAPWEFTFTNKACPITVTPPAPTPVDVCGTDNDGYFIPFKFGVKYKVNNHTKSFGFHSATGSVTITAYSTGAPYVLGGQTSSWTFDFTNSPCVSVSVDSTQPCVEHGAKDGEISVTVKNNHLVTKAFRVTVDGNTEYEFIAPGQTETFSFSGFAPGSYDVTVDELTANSSSFVAAPATLNITQFNQHHSWFHWENIYTDEATINECPREEPTDVCPLVTGIQTTTADCPPGQVLGDTTPTPTGHILSTSTTLPSVLPATGGTPVPTGLLPLVGAVAAYLVAYNRSSRKNAKA